MYSDDFKLNIFEMSLKDFLNNLIENKSYK